MNACKAIALQYTNTSAHRTSPVLAYPQDAGGGVTVYKQQYTVYYFL